MIRLCQKRGAPDRRIPKVVFSEKIFTHKGPARGFCGSIHYMKYFAGLVGVLVGLLYLAVSFFLALGMSTAPHGSWAQVFIGTSALATFSWVLLLWIALVFLASARSTKAIGALMFLATTLSFLFNVPGTIAVDADFSPVTLFFFFAIGPLIFSRRLFVLHYQPFVWRDVWLLIGLLIVPFISFFAVLIFKPLPLLILIMGSAALVALVSGKRQKTNSAGPVSPTAKNTEIS